MNNSFLRRQTLPTMRVLVSLLCLVACVMLSAFAIQAQTLSRFDRERGKQMLGVIKGDIKKNYYDPNFRGIDLDAKFKAAEAKIEQATSLNQVFGIIAQTLIDFNDSHLYFVPPPRPGDIEYGWKMQMIGDECYVVAVKPGSDAAQQGIKEGDRIVAVERFQPIRKEFWKIQYYYNALSPRAALELVVQPPNGQPRQVVAKAKVTQGKRVLDLSGAGSGSDADINDYIRRIEASEYLNRHRFKDFGADVMIWKMPAFDLSESQIDEVMNKAQGKRALIIDMRGNGGGYEITLKRLIGHFFDRDIQVAELKGRKEMKPLVAKARSKKPFDGKVVVLVDSESGSSAELFARVMQLEKRGVVIGDRTAGAVMRALYMARQMGTDTIVPYGTSITDADSVMSDGKSLEHTGVTPDELLLPSGADIAAKRDLVLVRAAALVGVRLDATQAGAMFPVEWKR